MKLKVHTQGRIRVIQINRPERRNAIDGETADLLAKAVSEFDGDASVDVAVIAGAGSNFCAGADLKALSESGDEFQFSADGNGPLGPTRWQTRKPLIAAVEGYAVAGGLELALFCDLRVAAETAVFGVFCRRWGVPLVDGGTVRLPRLIGHSRAMDMILTGRPVAAQEALTMGLANRVVGDGDALASAIALAETIAGFPQGCLRHDRASALAQWDLDWDAAIANEYVHGSAVIASGETASGAKRFSAGAGRHGSFAGED